MSESEEYDWQALEADLEVTSESVARSLPPDIQQVLSVYHAKNTPAALLSKWRPLAYQLVEYGIVDVITAEEQIDEAWEEGDMEKRQLIGQIFSTIQHAEEEQGVPEEQQTTLSDLRTFEWTDLGREVMAICHEIAPPLEPEQA